ncbi:signal recognition particle-docking protein FtsY [Candidatus Woesearchaeota archaeon]|nr:signal recognition particle-docking protein FtsY [Candidatus Woesearchaeota archaeon]
MFKFLKEKLKGALSKFTKKVAEEAPEEVQEVTEQKEGEEGAGEEVSREEIAQAEEVLERARGEVQPEEVFEKATGIPAAKAQREQEKKLEVQEAIAKVQGVSEEEKVEEQAEEIAATIDFPISEEGFVEQEEVAEIEPIIQAEEVFAEPTPTEPSFDVEIKEAQDIFTKEPEEEKREAFEVPELDLVSEVEEVPEEPLNKQIVPKKIEQIEVEEPKKGFFGKLKDKFTRKKEVAEEKIVWGEEKKFEEEKEEIFEEGKKEKGVFGEFGEEERAFEEKKEEKIKKIEPSFEVPDFTVTEQELVHAGEPEVKKKEEPERKGFFAKLTEKVVTKKISEEQFDELFWDLEVVLLENNVAVTVIEKIKDDLKKKLVDQPVRRSALEETIVSSLKESIAGILSAGDLLSQINLNKKKPFIICFVGINGSGKTTTIAKVAHLLQGKGKSVLLAAADTFRAAAIDQLEEHAQKLGVKLIKHDYGSDAAAVAFDAIKHAQAKNIDVVLIDTAGRLHSNVNLVDEMKKIIRIAKPDIKIFVGESITGNDCVEQAMQFNEAIGIDGIILSKADIDEKGGAALSVSYVTQKPIFFIGTGQGYKDLKAFDPKLVMESLGL